MPLCPQCTTHQSRLHPPSPLIMIWLDTTIATCVCLLLPIPFESFSILEICHEIIHRILWFRIAIQIYIRLAMTSIVNKMACT